MSIMKKIVFVLFLCVYSAANADTFVIQKIRIDGLKRISNATVLSYLPIKEGDRIDTAQSANIIRALYKTDFFSDVTVMRNKNDLVIKVVERAVIGSVNISGNNKITTKQLNDVLKNAGLAPGQSLDQALLNAIQQAVIEQYNNLGMYDAHVVTNVTSEDKNRVAVAINITEGPVAKIKLIKIIGNKSISEKKLLKEFSLSVPKFWNFFSSSDQYSREKLDADLEKLRSYYMDHGYLHMRINSTQVSMTPDKKHIYITVNIFEGDAYKLKGFSLEGNVLGKHDELVKLITLKAGDIFSRKDIIEAQGVISVFLGDYGYGMPDIRIMSELDEKAHQVFVKFLVNPGRRVYVRSINFTGNRETHDDVLRREMRQQEGSLFSLSKINESRRRLANLGYLQDIDYKATPVSGSPDQIDLGFDVKETSAKSLNAQVGYSDADGFLYGGSINDQNFLGTGKRVSLGLNNDKATQYYSLSYYDPYFTVNNVSLYLSGYMQRESPGKVRLSAYSMNTYGVAASFGMPVSDYTRVDLGLGVDHIEIGTSMYTNSIVRDFLKYGSVFNQLKLTADVTYNSMDRALFPTEGFSHMLNLEGGLPLDKKSLEFYRVDYRTSYYQPLFMGFIFHTNTDLGYGNGFGKTKHLPFFKNFYAGGIGSVRGFEANSLGRMDDWDNALGGNIITVASANVIVPLPIMKDNLRTSVFLDAGNIYADTFRLRDIRCSTGVQVEWRTPIAPLVFSLGKAIRSNKGDRVSIFNFSISAGV